MNQDHAYIHQEWHRAASTRDIPALIALYAHDAILESPLVPVIMDGKSDGVLRGKAEIERFLQAGARSRPIDLVRWHRSDTFFSVHHPSHVMFRRLKSSSGSGISP
jgi:steroid Delta-isomerase